MLNSQNCFKPNFLKTGVKNENRNVTCDQKLSSASVPLCFSSESSLKSL